MIANWVGCLFGWFKEEVRNAWSRVQERVSVIQNKAREGIWGFLTGPLSENRRGPAASY